MGKTLEYSMLKEKHPVFLNKLQDEWNDVKRFSGSLACDSMHKFVQLVRLFI